MLSRLFRRAPAPLTVHDIARLGGRASAERQRAPIRERTRELQRDLGWPDDPRIPA